MTMLPPFPAPKPERKPRKRRDPREWQRKGTERYAAKRQEHLMDMLAEDPDYRPLPDTNPERLARLREVQFAISSGYWKHTREEPCAACGSFDPRMKSDPAHVGKTRGAGAKADKVLSLCRACHDWEHADTAGFEAAFKERHGVTPEEMARCRFEQYHREHQ